MRVASAKIMPVFQIFLFLVLGLGFAQAQTTNNQIVPFRKVGQKVEFSQPQGSVSFSLQSQARSGAPDVGANRTLVSSSGSI